MGKVFANGLGDLRSIPGRVPKIFEMVLDTSLRISQPYKVRIKGKVEQSRDSIKGKVEQSRDRNSVLSYTSV